jgi:hypothetical protein
MTAAQQDKTTVPCGRAELLDLHALRADLARREGRALRDLPLGAVLRRLIDNYRATALRGQHIQ